MNTTYVAVKRRPEKIEKLAIEFDSRLKENIDLKTPVDIQHV